MKYGPAGERNSFIVLDTGVLIAHLRNWPGSRSFLQFLGKSHDLAASVITVVEVWQGAKPEEYDKTHKMLSSLNIINLDYELSRLSGNLASSLRSKGFTIGLADAVIGATALRSGSPVLTTNIKHFMLIPGLEVWDLKEKI